MPTIKYTREDITKLVNELDQYKTAHDKLTTGLKEAVAESIKYKRERDLLIEDIELLRKNQKTREEVIEQLKSENKALRLQADEYFGLWQDVDSKYKKLTEHIKDKALNNPSEHRYFRLVHFIDDLKADTHERS
ncbi:hypothetical protein P3U44_07035 [Mammaliicoccus sciuri]|uniref:hypothetical protein n=1 Tax=Mammaliicoccus sciuri TaxID=1296 RepID=UPI002B25B0F5|nr:hypothetical protein [Mammaliicoccus sciuri]WQJ75268.1 hypothetical protein P3U44_07035 [Mammaliicoccus sciuri]